MRGMRQLAANEHGEALGQAPTALATLTCLAIDILFCASHKSSSRPGSPQEAFAHLSLRDSLVRTSVFEFFLVLIH